MQTKKTIAYLNKLYKNVLIKCFMLNAAVFVAGAISVSEAKATTITPTLGNPAYKIQNITGQIPDADKFFTTFTIMENGVEALYGVSFDASNTASANPYTSITNGSAANHTFKIAKSPSADITNPDDYIYFTVENNGTQITDTANRTLSPNNNTNENFIGNDASSDGGAIVNNTNNLNGIVGDFIGNTADGVNTSGGAIYNSMSIASITGNFIGNSANDNIANGDGGAISNGNVITTITGDFIGNFASNGGAICNYNSISSITGDFINNYSTINGGAIYNFSDIGTITSSFIGNGTTGNGGAIYTINDLKFAADGKVNIFSGNISSTGSNAIYIAGNDKTLTFEMTNAGGGFVMNDGISGSFSYDVVIKGDDTNNVFYLNNTIDTFGSVTLENATLHFGSITQASTLYQGSVHSFNTLGTSIISGDAVITGSASINGNTTFTGSAHFYRNASFTGSATLAGDTTLNGNVLQAINNNSAHSIANATSVIIHNLSNGIDGRIIASLNSYILLGLGDSSYAANSFSTSNLDWGANSTAALFVMKPQTLERSGSINIDGKSSSVFPADHNSASFTSNSLLVVDAAGIGSSAAITSNGGELTVASNAKLHITNVQNDQIVKIVDGFTGPGGLFESDAWTGDNLTSSSGIQSVKVADFDVSTGSYSVQVFGIGVDEILKNFNQMQGRTAQVLLDLSPDVDSVDAATKFLSRATDMTYLGTNDPKKATAMIEGMGQAAGVLGTSATTLDVAKTLSEVVASKLGSATSDEKNMPSGDAGGESKLEDVSMWVMPLYNYTNVNGFDAGNLESDYETSMGGVAFGADKTVDDYRLGVAFSAGAGSTDAKGDFDGSNEFDFYSASIYGSKNVNDIKITADVGLTYTNNDIKQYLGALSMTDANGDVNSYALSLGALAEKTFDKETFKYTPYAGARFTSLYTGNYEMKNSDGVISSTKSNSQNILQIPVGVALKTMIESDSDWSIKPKAKAGVVLSLGELKAVSNTTFTGVGNAKYNMDNVDALAFDGGIGLEMQKDNVTIDFGYNLLASLHEYSHTISANIKWDF